MKAPPSGYLPNSGEGTFFSRFTYSLIIFSLSLSLSVYLSNNTVPLPLPLPLHPITKKTTIHIISRSDSDDDDDRSHEEGKHGFEFVWEMEVQILGVSGHVSSGVLVHVHRHRLAPLVCHSQFPFQRH